MRPSICENSLSVIESIRNAIDASADTLTATGNTMIAFVFVIFLCVTSISADKMVNISNFEGNCCDFLNRFAQEFFTCFITCTWIGVKKKLERAQAAGASIECHYVTTEDGYILRLYHIPPMPNTSIESNKTKTIFFMHGLQSSSLDYVIYPNISLGEYCSYGFVNWCGKI